MARGSPGPQNPSKYPKTGANYKRWGELTQQGYTYNPETDTYVADPAGAKKQLEDEGLIEGPPKEESLTDTLLPIGASAAALAGGKKIGEYLTSNDALSVLKDTATSVGDMFTGGGGAEEVFLAPGGNPAEYLPGASGLPGAAPGAAPEAAGAFDVAGIGAEGNLFLPAAGAFGAYDLLTNDYGAGRGALQGAASGAAMGSYFGPWGAVAGGVIGGGVGLGKSLLDHESTKDAQKRRWSELAQSSDPILADYAKSYLQQVESGPSDEAMDRGRNFNQLLSSGDIKPEEVWGSLDVVKTPGWLTGFSEEERRKISDAALDEGLFYSNKGDIRLKDSSRFNEIANQIKSGTYGTKADPNAGLLVPEIDLQNTGAKSPLVIDPTKMGMLA